MSDSDDGELVEIAVAELRGISFMLAEIPETGNKAVFIMPRDNDGVPVGVISVTESDDLRHLAAECLHNATQLDEAQGRGQN